MMRFNFPDKVFGLFSQRRSVRHSDSYDPYISFSGNIKLRRDERKVLSDWCPVHLCGLRRSVSIKKGCIVGEKRTT